ncbi:MAG: nuclear transport factor 2 family protein [Vicinamibacteria bacterium]|nr:nuclear transport factor 2 family protein [Vicinamibacteria bacterium]
MGDPRKTVMDNYAAFGRGDVQAILATLAPDVAWENWSDNHGQRAGVPWLRARHGAEAVGGFFDALRDLQFHAFDVDWVLAEGPRVAAHVSVDVTVASTGLRYRDEEIHLWTFDEAGRIVAFRHYCDTAKHLAAAGKVLADARP